MAACVQDPYHMPSYLRHSPFLPDINNERPAKNETYRENLAGLEQLVLFRFVDDVTVVPRDSAWFSFFDGQKLVALRDQPIYQVRTGNHFSSHQAPTASQRRPAWDVSQRT